MAQVEESRSSRVASVGIPNIGDKFFTLNVHGSLQMFHCSNTVIVPTSLLSCSGYL